MALDVQPLSRKRRMVRLTVLLGILAASLIFAAWLTARAHNFPKSGPNWPIMRR